MTTDTPARAEVRGVALFGGDPAALGWCAVPGEPCRRIGLRDLPAGLWWTDLSPLDVTGPDVLTASYLPVTQAEALHDWGYGRRATDLAFTATVCAVLFDRVMALADAIDGGTDRPGASLAERLARMLPFEARGDDTPVLGPGHSDLAPGRYRRGLGLEFERPALALARELFETPIPDGPVTLPLAAGPDPADLQEAVRATPHPCIADVTIPDRIPAHVRGLGLQPGRRHVAHPEFMLLGSLCEVEVHGALVGGEYRELGASLPASWRAFVEADVHAVSWSSGILAEAMIAAVARPWQRRRTWAGEWVASADLATTTIVALGIEGRGHRVGGAQGGRFWLDEPPTRLGAAVRDCAGLGLMPGLTQIPPGFLPPRGELAWKGFELDRSVFEARVFRDLDALWNLDRIPLLPSALRAGLLKAIHRNGSATVTEMPRA